MSYKFFDNKEFEEMLGQLEEATASNQHSEALVMIADFFGYQEYYDYFEAFAKKESITLKESHIRHNAMERMFVVIKAEYGFDVVSRLNDSLK